MSRRIYKPYEPAELKSAFVKEHSQEDVDVLCKILDWVVEVSKFSLDVEDMTVVSMWFTEAKDGSIVKYGLSAFKRDPGEKKLQRVIQVKIDGFGMMQCTANNNRCVRVDRDNLLRLNVVNLVEKAIEYEEMKKVKVETLTEQQKKELVDSVFM